MVQGVVALSCPMCSQVGPTGLEWSESDSSLLRFAITGCASSTMTALC